jgi:hypothetical protein
VTFRIALPLGGAPPPVVSEGEPEAEVLP